MYVSKDFFVVISIIACACGIAHMDAQLPPVSYMCDPACTFMHQHEFYSLSFILHGGSSCLGMLNDRGARSNHDFPVIAAFIILAEGLGVAALP
jgi:hypothetical protein